jgi:rhomboid protease GluP
MDYMTDKDNKPEAEESPLVAILRHCAAAAPEPWYPSAHARTTGIPRDSLDSPLERLRLGGLVELTPWTQGNGQGYRLTPQGEEVLHAPRQLNLLRAGRMPERAWNDGDAAEPGPGPLTTYDRGEIVRAGLDPFRGGFISRILLLANLAVFLYGVALAGDQGLLSDYLSGSSRNPKLWTLQHTLGALTGLDIVQGEWWKLMTACFVHFGWIHLACNLFGLYVLGPVVEQMWGRWRFLFIYLVSGLAGSCAMLWANPDTHGAGASGALWGLMTSYPAWLFLNRRHLPGPIDPGFLRNLVVVFLVNIFISTMPGISAAAHFGGGAAGIVAAALANAERFSVGPVRWLAALGMALLPVVCVGALVREMQTDPQWARLVKREAHRRTAEEIATFNEEWLPPIRDKMKKADKVWNEQVKPATDRRPERRDPEEVPKALAAAAAQEAELNRLGQWIDGKKPFTDADVDKARLAGKDYVQAGSELFRQAQSALQKGEPWKDDPENSFEQKKKAWRQLLE